MARARNIKPGFFKNEFLAEIPPLGRILFAGLWTLADRDGRLEDRPKRIKSEILPYDNCDVDKLLDQLAKSSEQFIIRYSADGKGYIAIPKFSEHQHPHMREGASKIPAPDKHGASTVQEQDKHRTSPALTLNPITLTLNPIHDVGQADCVPQIHKHFGNGKCNADIPYADIVDDLNKLAGTVYKHTSKATRKHIHARWVEGYRLPDFYCVNEKKVKEWQGTEMAKYLRPETLYGSKFENYLNQPETSSLQSKDPPGRRSLEDEHNKIMAEWEQKKAEAERSMEDDTKRT